MSTPHAIASPWHALVVVMTLFVAVQPVHAAQPAASPKAATADRAALDRLVDAEHAAARFDGEVLVGIGDEVVYRRVVGLADRASRRAHRVGDPWRWASVSKQVTGVLAMQQVQAGALSLDATLDTVLPGFVAPNAARITVRDLLRHTSGLPNPDDTADDGHGMPRFYSATFARDQRPLDAALAYCAGLPKAAPGAGFAYDNCDTLVLQAILERVTGQPYDALLTARIATPLGLSSLAVRMDGSDLARAGATATQATLQTGYLADGSREPAINLATFGAGGALIGTADDLWRFDRALIEGTLLDAAATATLWTGEPTLGYVALGAWSFAAPLKGCTGSVRLIERRGAIGGVQVRNLIAPDLHAALVVFSNTSATDFGELWQGRGLGYDLASAAFCG